ncbi:phage tail protein [Mycolicibacterium mucogenicum]|uniref:Phage tail protein n=1 Tax=Mycolicibacterium mucogenicum TaxID=56689 RepID=A0A1A3GXM9_MYCMU|nr:phage tail protein [Mycolicibacterium mucogenicum]OBJ40585.1 phage tail protein [Mycolicibacterium mucogenicum]
MADDDAPVGVAFAVELDKTSIGMFNSCEGLGLEVVLEQREEGGNNMMVWQLPTRMKYSNIKLTRPVGPDSHKLTTWITKALHSVQPITAVISALTADGKPVAKWSLNGVVPVRWTGPSLNLDSPKVFTETLEIAHHGFLEGGA